MRFMHLADLHLGKQLAGFPLINDQRFALESILRLADEQQVHALVLAGDLYDKTTPSAEATALLDWFLTQAAAQSLPVISIPGNHDSAERVGYASALLAREGIYVPGVFDGSLGHVQLHDHEGPVNFWLLPFVKPAHVRAFFPDTNIGQNYTEAVRAVIESAPVDPAQRNVLVAHQFATSGGFTPTRSDSELNVGGLDNVDAATFDPFDYVALGHIHRPQRVGRDEVRYAGSLLKYSLSEANYPKSAVIVDLGPKTAHDEAGTCASIRLEPLKPLHDLREIKGPLDELVSEEVVAAQDAFDYLHVTLTDERPLLDAFARLRAVYPNVIALDYDNASTRHRADLSPALSAVHEELDAAALFAQFFREQNGVTLTTAQEEIVHTALENALAAEGGAR